MNIWVVIQVLNLAHTHGPLFVPAQQWQNLWSINLMIIQLCLRPSHNSRCTTFHQIQCQIWSLTLRILGAYLIRLNSCRVIWLKSKVTRTLRTIWCVSSRIEAVKSKHQQHNSRLPALFLLMILSMEREIFKYSRVYNLNNDINEPYVKISLTYNSVTEWVAPFLPIISHQKDTMVIF